MQSSQFISLGEMKVFPVPVASARRGGGGQLSGPHVFSILDAKVIFPMWDCLGTVGLFLEVLFSVISNDTPPFFFLKHISDS